MNSIPVWWSSHYNNPIYHNIITYFITYGDLFKYDSESVSSIGLHTTENYNLKEFPQSQWYVRLLFYIPTRLPIYT